jgi:hypothetical protein
MPRTALFDVSEIHSEPVPSPPQRRGTMSGEHYSGALASVEDRNEELIQAEKRGYERGRREVFEEANAKAHSGCGISAFFDWLRSRAVEEGSDD